MWNALQTQYEGSGVVLEYNTIIAYTDIKYDDYRLLEEFVLAFKKKIKKLVDLDIEPPKN
jgi:hypothetical protein